jgi:hypothetical protein
MIKISGISLCQNYISHFGVISMTEAIFVLFLIEKDPEKYSNILRKFLFFVKILFKKSFQLVWYETKINVGLISF